MSKNAMPRPQGKEFRLKVTPKQEKMIISLEDVDELFYGGQAGGGKSEGLLLFALKRRLECPGSVGLMLRKTYPDLERSLIRKSHKYYRNFAKYNESKRKWTFPNSSIQEFGHCERDNDVHQYQSAEYDDLEFDELTHFTEFQYIYLLSRLRQATGGKWKTLVRSASNPGNVGHAWVKSRFVDCAKDKVFTVFDEILGSNKTRYFLPAALDDNTMMPVENRKEYKAWLSSLPPEEKRMLMEGDWDFVPGAAFGEFNREIHVYNVNENPVPGWAELMCSFDWGFGRPFSVGWWWIDRDGRMWRFNEWYGWNGKPNQGRRMAPSQVAKGIIDREKLMGLTGRYISRVADPACFNKQANIRGGGVGPSIAEMMDEAGIHFSPSDNERLLGKAQVHERLRVPENGLPMMMIGDNCEHFLRTFPGLVLDENNIEDIDTDQEDHAYDEVRYGCMSRPLIPEHEKPDTTYFGRIIKRVQESEAVNKDNEYEWLKDEESEMDEMEVFNVG